MKKNERALRWAQNALKEVEKDIDEVVGMPKVGIFRFFSVSDNSNAMLIIEESACTCCRWVVVFLEKKSIEIETGDREEITKFLQKLWKENHQ
jgi:hypothetical protein